MQFVVCFQAPQDASERLVGLGCLPDGFGDFLGDGQGFSFLAVGAVGCAAVVFVSVVVFRAGGGVGDGAVGLDGETFPLSLLQGLVEPDLGFAENFLQQVYVGAYQSGLDLHVVEVVRQLAHLTQGSIGGAAF